jgi:hypothetical protein
LKDRQPLDREEVLKSFQGQQALRDAWQWNSDARALLDELEISKRDQPQEGVALAALDLLITRMRRYFLALALLSTPVNKGEWTHAIDGYHAVHKSLFETYIEFAACLVYLEKFGLTGDFRGLDLLQRLRLHAETTSLKKNREHKYRKTTWESLHTQVKETGHDFHIPASAEKLMSEDMDVTGQRLKNQIEQLQGPGVSISQYKHWFPEKNLQGEYFVADEEKNSQRPRNCGSIEWLCKAVLARHAIGRDLWINAYNHDYALINLYTHPAMGYDDCFRGTPERFMDLAQMQLSMRWMFHEVVLPPLRTFHSTLWVNLVEREERLRRLHHSTTALVLPYLFAVHQQDRTTSVEGPNLWA